MTDRYNTKPSQDPQSVSIMDGYNTEEKKYNDDVDLYEAGMALLAKYNYHPSGSNYELIFTSPSKAPKIKGIKFPKKFMPRQIVASVTKLKYIRSIFESESPELYAFWKPVWSAHNGMEKIFQIHEYIRALKSKERDTQDYLEYGQTHLPVKDGELCVFPSIFVPSKEWFKESLWELEFKDIFSIFPDAECNMLQLILGRIAVGRSGHLPPNFDEEIAHTCRMMAIIVGRSAGLGKSTLFEKFFKAIEKCGFVRRDFRKIGDRFGLANIALSDVAYQDDTTKESLKNLLTADVTKTLVTNGRVETEEKNEHKEVINSKCVVLANSNDFDPQLSYKLDPGSISRIKLLSTYRRSELNRIAEETGENQEPYYKIPKLAEKHGVSEDAIMLWAFRLAADKFYEVITTTKNGRNALECEVNRLSGYLRYSFQTQVESAIIKSLMLARFIRVGYEHIPELSAEVLMRHMNDFYFIATDPSCKKLFDVFKADWERNDRSLDHFYVGIRQLRWESMKKIIFRYVNNPNITIKEIFTSLQLRNHISLGSGETYIVNYWNDTRIDANSIAQEAEGFLKQISKAEVDYIRNLENEPNDMWMSHKGYTPELAEKYTPDFEAE